MLDQKLIDQITTHRILNYLNSTAQARFAFFNILGQLQSQTFKIELLENAKQNIAQVSKWLDGLWDGETLFEQAKGAHQSEEAEKARNLAASFIPELNNISSVVHSILMDRNYAANNDAVAILLAAYGRSCYGRDNYIRGFIEFGRIFNDHDLVRQWEQYIERSEADIKDVNQCVLIIKEKNLADKPNFFDHLRFTCRTLPGIFQAQIHDLNQVICTYYKEFNFDAAKIEKSDARIWDRLEFSALEAGYWRAHGFSPELAAEWVKVGFIDPLLAAEWASIGLDAKAAKEWAIRQFPPILALQWFSEKYTPDEALNFVNEGYQVPFELPEEKKIKRDNEEV